MWMLLAQMEALSGATGWTSFGIAGLVLAWLLLKHIPEKDKQLKDLIDAHSIQTDKAHDDCRIERKEVDARHVVAIKDMFLQFDISLKAVLQQSSHDAERLTAGVQNEMKSLGLSVAALGQTVEALGKAVEALGKTSGAIK